MLVLHFVQRVHQRWQRGDEQVQTERTALINAALESYWISRTVARAYHKVRIGVDVARHLNKLARDAESSQNLAQVHLWDSTERVPQVIPNDKQLLLRPSCLFHERRRHEVVLVAAVEAAEALLGQR